MQKPDSDYFKIVYMQNQIEKSKKMSLMIKGITVMLLFTIFFCARNGELLTLYMDIPITIVVFFVDCHFVKAANNYQTQLEIMSENISENNENRIKYPVIFYVIILFLIMLGITLLK